MTKCSYPTVMSLFFNFAFNIVLNYSLSISGITMPSIVGVEWRLDYVVRSKHGGRENFPLFLVSLQVRHQYNQMNCIIYSLCIFITYNISAR